MTLLLTQGNALQIPLGDESVHCVVTSPPYWGLRDYGIGDQLGLESTPEEYVANMVAVFREVRRVLRADGTVWLNLGDSYASNTKGTGGPSDKQESNAGSRYEPRKLNHGLKVKDLVGIPWLVAMALREPIYKCQYCGIEKRQSQWARWDNGSFQICGSCGSRCKKQPVKVFDGWWLRSDIIWAKPNPMPESVTDRPTKSHEYLFLMTKSARYYYDADAVREGYQGERHAPGNVTDNGRLTSSMGHFEEPNRVWGNPSGRNRRTVWHIATAPYSGAHFATYPPALVEPCIKAGTSEHGVCPECGSPWERVTERTEGDNQEWAQDINPTDKESALIKIGDRAGHGKLNRGSKEDYYANSAKKITLGWQPTCDHKRVCPSCAGGSVEWTVNSPCCNNEGYVSHDPVPATVFDPFAGSGTTLQVARALGRNGVGLDLSLEYLQLARKRLSLDALDAWTSGGKKDGATVTDLPMFKEED